MDVDLLLEDVVKIDDGRGWFELGVVLEMFAEARIASLTDCGRSIVGIKFGGILVLSLLGNFNCLGIS